MDKKKNESKFTDGNDKNRDPLSGSPGAHPIGTGAGAAGGAATGAAIGTAIGGPVGFAVGGVAGAVAGGLAGKGIAEAINPTAEDEYWRENYSSRPYVSQGTSYDTLQPAYRYGWESRSRYDGRSWTDVEDDLRSGWDQARGSSKMKWDDAKHATRDAWNRLDEDNARMDDDGAMTGTQSTRVNADQRMSDRSSSGMSSGDRAGSSSSSQRSRR
jgi:hypothetical protein